MGSNLNCEIFRLRYQERDENYAYIKLTTIISIFLNPDTNYEINIYANPLKYKYNFILTDSSRNTITYEHEETCKEHKIVIMPNTLSLIKTIKLRNLTNLQVVDLENCYIIVKYFKIVRDITINFSEFKPIQETNIKYLFMNADVNTYYLIKNITGNYKMILARRSYIDGFEYQINFFQDNILKGNFKQNDVIIPPLYYNLLRINITDDMTFLNNPVFIFLFPNDVNIDYALISNLVNSKLDEPILYGISPYTSINNIEPNYKFYFYTDDINNINNNVDLQISDDKIISYEDKTIKQYKNNISPETINLNITSNKLKAFFIVNPSIIQK